MKISSKPLFFKTTADLRKWFENHHDQSTEIWIGFYKKNSGKVSVSYAAALDQAICFGWIDGIRKSLNELSYANRFAEIARAQADGRWSN